MFGDHCQNLAMQGLDKGLKKTFSKGPFWPELSYEFQSITQPKYDT